MAHTTRTKVLHSTRPWRESMGSRASGQERRHNRPPLRLLAGASLAALLLVTGCGGKAGGVDKAGGPVTAAPINLKMANTRGEEAQPFLDELAKVSGGALQLTAEPGFQGATKSIEVGALQAVQSGHADIAIVPTRAYAFVGVTSFDALVAPMLVDNIELQQQVINDSVASEMLDGVKSAGFAGIGVLPGPIRLPSGVSRPLIGPATYSGARIAYTPSPVAKQSLEALGAIPVEAAFDGQDVNGFDGLELQAKAVAENQYDGVVRSITANVGLWPRPIGIVANAGSWAKLTEAQRGWLVQAAKDAVEETASRQASTEDIANMCRRNKVKIISASEDQIAQLRRAVTPVYDSLRGNQETAAYLDRIQAIKDRLGSTEPGQPIDCAALTGNSTSTSSPLDTSASRLDGNYSLSFTDQEMLAAGASPDEVMPENWGELRLVLDHGRFASTQYNEQACTWNYGTYTLTGTTIELTLAGGGGKGPNDAFSKPGEVFDYGVSLYHDTMKMSAVPDAVSPSAFTIKPWHRDTGKPSADYLDKRCPPPEGWNR
jgi:TRAP-type C4-dicarboxylate transport system substrate-binding protein